MENSSGISRLTFNRKLRPATKMVTNAPMDWTIRTDDMNWAIKQTFTPTKEQSRANVLLVPRSTASTLLATRYPQLAMSLQF